MARLPCAEHLNSEQVDYELVIRNALTDEVDQLDLVGKQTLLRTFFKKDIKNWRNYASPYTIGQEYEGIRKHVALMYSALLKNGPTPKIEARLLHYWFRTKRCLAATEEEKTQRREMVRELEGIMRKFQIEPPSPAQGQLQHLLNPGTGNGQGGEGLGADGNPAGSSGTPGRGNPPPPPGSGSGTPTTPVHNNNGGSGGNGGGNGNPAQDAEMDKRLTHMERLLSGLSITVTDMAEQQKSQLNQSRTLLTGNNAHNKSTGTIPKENPRLRVRRSGLFSPAKLSDSSDEDDDTDLRDRHRTIAKYWGKRRGNDHSRKEQSDDDLSSLLSYGSRGRRRYADRFDDRNLLFRIEKWRLKFSGDDKSMSIEDFLYKLETIAWREGISQEKIFRHVHLFLEGSATDWFFTFVDEMDDWESFEKLIRLRFGNPNQDQGIRNKIQERKQYRNEKFIAFATEIEKLNKQLSRPLSAHRKFQTLWENMRPHYRTKLAAVAEIKTLNQLLEVCRRIDAVDTNLYPSAEPSHQRTVNNVDVENDNDSEQSVDVNAVRPRQMKDNRYASRQRQQSEQERERTNAPYQQPSHQQRTEMSQANLNQQGHQRHNGSGETSGVVQCWNCLEAGHIWRECTRPKVIFCYGCGNLGRTITCCERCTARNVQFSGRNNQGN